MDIQSQVVNIDNWTVRIQEPAGGDLHPVILMVHGLTGDENVTWIFASRLPKEALLIAPRGLHPAQQGGYSWQPERSKGWPKVDDLIPAVDQLLDLLIPANFPTADFSRLHLMGFSQGAAVCYSLALLHPEKVQSVAGLAGFMPEGVEGLVNARPLIGKKAFVAHGNQDETVPIERARQAVQQLEKAGAQVSYCEDQVGHKLSATCFRGLDSFFSAGL